MRWLILLLACLAAGTGVLIAGSERVRPHFLTPQEAQVTAVPGAPAGERMIYASGIVEGAHREIPLHFEIEGRLAAIHVREGQQVHKGDLLAELDPSIWQNQLDEATAKLALAEAQRARLFNAASSEARSVAKARVRVAQVRVSQTRTDYERAHELREKNAISQQEWEKARHDYQQALAEYELAAAQAAEVEAAARDDDLQVADAQIALARATADHARSTLKSESTSMPESWSSVPSSSPSHGRTAGPCACWTRCCG